MQANYKFLHFVILFPLYFNTAVEKIPIEKLQASNYLHIKIF